MSKPEILQMGEYPEWDETPLQAEFIMRRYFEAADPAGFLAQHGAGIRGVASKGNLTVPVEVMDALPNLEIISVYGVGYDGVDVEACRSRGIKVTNTPDVLTKDVADFGVAMMLAQSRGILGGQAWTASGKWSSEGGYALQSRVHGKRAAILGLGRIGYEVARRLAAFDMEISYSDIGPKDFATDWTFVAEPVALAAQADFLFVTLSASADTHHIVNAEVLRSLGPEGMVINISRAANIDEGALLDALESGEVGSAAIDVFDNEPDLDPRWLALDNVLLQPHQASGTFETRKSMGKLMRDNLSAHFAGKPLLTPVT